MILISMINTRFFNILISKQWRQAARNEAYTRTSIVTANAGDKSLTTHLSTHLFIGNNGILAIHEAPDWKRANRWRECPWNEVTTHTRSDPTRPDDATPPIVVSLKSSMYSWPLQGWALTRALNGNGHDSLVFLLHTAQGINLVTSISLLQVNYLSLSLSLSHLEHPTQRANFLPCLLNMSTCFL